MRAAQFGFNFLFGLRRIRSLYWLRDNVLALDLLYLLAYRTIDFSDLRRLFTSGRPVRTRIGANLRAVY